MTVSFDFSKRVAVVTGASSGIGKSIAETLLRYGCIVFGIGRDAKRLKPLESIFPNYRSIPLDISVPISGEKLAKIIQKETKHLDFIVNCAGTFYQSSIIKTKYEDFDRMYRTNVLGILITTKECLRLLRLGDKPAIVNIGSVLATVGACNTVAYSASKGAVVSLTKAMAQELAPLGIRVNCISPGHVETPMIENLIRKAGNRKKLSQKYPLGRIGMPKDVVDMALFLLSDSAGWITGQNIIISGGREW